MNVRVQLFARARDLAGRPEVELSLPEGARVSDLLRQLTTDCPALAALAPRLFVAINQQYATGEERLPPDAEIACFPPVSGG